MLPRFIALLTSRWFAPAAAAMVAVWLFILWQPERQVQLHQEHLIEAFADRNYNELQKFLAPGFMDRWGHDRETVLREVREILRQFLFLDIRQENPAQMVSGREGEVRAVIRMQGRGSPIAEYAMQMVNRLDEPFIFQWRRSGSWPWEWELASIDNPKLPLDRPAGF